MSKFLQKLFVNISLVLFTLQISNASSMMNYQSWKNRCQYIPHNDNKTPTAIAKATPTTAQSGEIIEFDGSQSSDEDGDIVAYEWKDGNNVLSTEVTFSIDTLTIGEHTIILTVKDNDNATDSDSIKVTITAADKDYSLKKTEQTACYEYENNEQVECSDEYKGQDGYYRAGVEPNYTRDDDKDIVTDHLRVLMWQDDSMVKEVTKAWLTSDNFDKCEQNQDESCYDTSGDTAATYCQNLTLGGYNDWRLPSRKELIDLNVYGANDTYIHPIFQNTTFRSFWSSTTYQGSLHNAWDISSYQSYSTKDTQKYIRCVRDINK